MRALIFLTYLVGLVLGYWWVECHVLDHCNPWVKTVVTAPDDPLARLTDLGLNASGTLPLNGYEQFNFDKNSNVPNLSENNNKFIDDLEKYMKDNPDDVVRITGYYLPDEKNKDSYDNMGVSRAAAIRDVLVKRGLKANRFDLRGEKLGEGSTLGKPLRFDAIAKEKGKKQLATTAQTFDDRTYYFSYNSDEFQPTDGFIKFTAELKAYLPKNKNKKVQVIGHTDADGSPEANMQLGRNRAREIRKYLIENGIPSKTISIDSKGETEPAATNDNDAGKAKNRRVRVRIK